MKFVILTLNSFLSDQNVKKNWIYNTIIKGVTTYGCEDWQVKKIKNITGFGSGLLAQISKNT